MVVGEAEIVSSAKTASVLHGRIGMTIRFVAPDDASKIVLGELERARLAMRPAPPSVPPRPAEIPAAPRPVPPRAAGRVDAVNALAECVAIGDVDALGGDPIPPKISQRFVAPTVPPAGGPSRSRSASTPPTDITEPMPAIVSAAPPAVTPIVAAPPAPIVAPETAATPVRNDAPVAPPTAGEPDAMRDLPPSVDLAPKPSENADLLTTMRGTAPAPTGDRATTTRGVQPFVPRTPTPSSPPPQARSSRMATPAAPMPFVQQPAPTAPAPAVPEEIPVPQVVASHPAPQPEVELDEPTEIAQQPPSGAVADDDRPSRAKRETRKTVMGVAVVPQGMVVVPAAASVRFPTAIEIGDTSQMQAQDPTAEPTGGKGRWIHDVPPAELVDEVDPLGVTVVPPVTMPQPVQIPNVEEPTPSGDWTMTPGVDGPKIIPTPRLPAPAVPAAKPITGPDSTSIPPGPPSGDWTISLDPSQPDGWRQASKVDELPSGERPPGPPVSAVSSDKALDSATRDADTEDDDLEPSVQIDPTLIDPTLVIQSDDEPASRLPSPPPTAPMSVALSSMQMPAQRTTEPMMQQAPQPPRHAPMTQAAVSKFTAPPMAQAQAPRHPRGGSNAAYPIEEQAMLQTQRVRAPSLQPVPRGPSSPGKLAHRKRLTLIIASSALAAMIGIGLIVAMTRGEREGTRNGVAELASEGSDTKLAGDDNQAKVVPPAHPVATPPGDAGVAVAAVPVDAAPPVASSTACEVDVITTPIGAEIVIGTNVLGLAPMTVKLPCGTPTKVLLRKQRFLLATRTVTPVAGNPKPLKLTLSRPIFSVKVSSTPAGATITLGTKLLGVTPTNIKLPAFEPSTLKITKEGFAPDLQKIAPKQNNQTVHSVLKKISLIKRPRY